MNQTQRKYLINAVEEEAKRRVKELEKRLLPMPALHNYLYQAVLNDTVVIQGASCIKAALRKMALNAREGENWLSGERMGIHKNSTVRLPIEALIQLPQEYLEERTKVAQHNQELESQAEEVKLQSKTLCHRLMLATDKALTTLSKEVDDMGDIKLMDTRLKQLT